MSAEFCPSAPTTPVYDEDGVQRFSELNAAGQEIPDPVPYELDLGVGDARPLGEIIAEELRLAAFRAEAVKQGFDTPEEADDLDIPDDPLDPQTPWEAEYEASQERIRQYIANRKASEGSSSEVSQSTKVETPNVASDGSRRDTAVVDQSSLSSKPSIADK